MSWAFSAVAVSIGTYLACFTAMLLVNLHTPKHKGLRSAGERGSGQHVWTSDSRKLAVVVPTHDGDVSRAFVSMKRWPTTCSSVTLNHVDLILYHATDTDKAALRAQIPKEATSCFRNTRVVSANLSPEVRRRGVRRLSTVRYSGEALGSPFTRKCG